MVTRKIILNDAHTLSSSDNDSFLIFTSDDPVTVTIPAGLGGEFECGLVQDGPGPVTVVAASGVELRNRQSHNKVAGRDGLASLVTLADDLVLLAGDTM